MTGLRLKRAGIATAYGATFTLLTLVHGIFIVGVGLLFLTRFRFWMYRQFFSSAECPTCGKSIPLEGSWQCSGCGFTQHRHAYRPCVKCKAVVVEVACPACQHGMFL